MNKQWFNSQRGRQETGQGRQGSITQIRDKGIGWPAGSGAGRVVRQAGTETGQARVKTRKARKRETGEKTGQT